jgi:hypothetical protein
MPFGSLLAVYVCIITLCIQSVNLFLESAGQKKRVLYFYNTLKVPPRERIGLVL